MTALAADAEKRMREGFLARMAALQRWTYGSKGSTMCPCCFGTWLSTIYTDGWESLRCNECGAQGPLAAEWERRNKAKVVDIFRLRTHRLQADTPAQGDADETSIAMAQGRKTG